jgi:ligand-binding sensor domain-containing protein
VIRRAAANLLVAAGAAAMWATTSAGMWATTGAAMWAAAGCASAPPRVESGARAAEGAPSVSAGALRPTAVRPPSAAVTSPADEWITIRDFRWVVAVGVSERVAYFGTTAGLERWDTLRETWLSPLTAADGLPDDHVTAVVAEPLGGDVWVGTRRGLARLGFDDVVDPVWGPLPAPVEKLLLDPRDGSVYAWIAGAWWGGRGASFSRVAAPPTGPLEGAAEAAELDPARVPWIDPHYARGVEVPALFRLTQVDRDLRGEWYAGTWGDNGRRWRSGSAEWDPLRFGLAGSGGGPMARARDGYWFAAAAESESGVLALAHASSELGAWSYVVPRDEPELPTAIAHSLLAIGDTLVVGSDFGIAWGTGANWVSPGHAEEVGRVAALALDGPVLWLGTDHGLVAWDRRQGRPAGTALRSRRITAIVAAPDALFVGAEEGLWATRRASPLARTDEAQAFADSLVEVEPRGRRIRALALHGDLLLVASDRGLEVFDRVRGTWRTFPVGEGRVSALPLALASDAENVWVGTERALVRWRPATDEWRVYGAGDGLAAVPVLYLLAEPDVVWASTPEGVSRFAWRSGEP